MDIESGEVLKTIDWGDMLKKIGSSLDRLTPDQAYFTRPPQFAAA